MATTKQVQLQEVNEDGSVTLVNPKNDARDISVGILTLGDATKIPGAEKNELLHTSLRNIAAHLYNIKDISKKLRTLSDSVADATDSTIPTSKVTAALNTRLGAAEATLTNHNTELGKRAPTMHAVNALTYGGGTGGVYGHVKLVDTYMTASVGGAASSIAASGNALYSAYNALNTAKANNNHAINGSTYGKGTSGVYGHVKTYDYNYTSAQGTSGIPDPVTSTDLSVVATQRALYSVWKRLSTKNTNQDTTIAGKAPTSHAVTSTTYGVGNTAVFGHLKLDNSYNSTSDEGNCGVTAGIAASSYAVRQAYSSLSSSIAGKLAASHATISSGVTATGKATGSSWGHTKLVDMGRNTAGKAAANGEAPSTLSIKAVWDAIKSAENTISTLNSNLIKTCNNLGVLTTTRTIDTRFSFSGYATSGSGTVYLYNLPLGDFPLSTIYIEKITINHGVLHIGSSREYDILGVTVSFGVFSSDLLLNINTPIVNVGTYSLNRLSAEPSTRINKVSPIVIIRINLEDGASSRWEFDLSMNIEVTYGFV